MLKRTDLIIPELLTEAIQGQYAGMIALWGTGAAIVSGTMPVYGPTGTKLRGGDRVTVPYFGTIGELDDVGNEGDALTPTSLAMTSESELVQHSGKAIEISNWAQLAAQYADPYGEMARQFMITLARRGDKALLDAAIGVQTNALPASNIADATGSNGPVNLVYDLMVDARMLWADEQADI